MNQKLCSIKEKTKTCIYIFLLRIRFDISYPSWKFHLQTYHHHQTYDDEMLTQLVWQYAIVRNNSNDNNINVLLLVRMAVSASVLVVIITNERGQCSKRSEIEAKAQAPSPDDDIRRTSSSACTIATSSGGLLGLLFDSTQQKRWLNLSI